MASWTCGLACTTAVPVSRVEDWLTENCQGDWTVRLAGFAGDIDSGKKKIEVLFETRDDMATFKARFKAYEAEVLRERGYA
jgi:hypothetical protein